jgi:glycosyltransferase involved in cell wall biosynthesis
MIRFIGSLGEKLAVYHVVDEYTAYGNLDPNRKEKFKIFERKMLSRADLVIVVSDKLYETKSAYNKHTYKVPNGVDYESYDRALFSEEPQPADIAQVPRPIVGYSGLISGRMDLGLLEFAAIKHPEWSLVLIGAINDRKCNSWIDRLRQLKNIHFLGLKGIKQVPHYIKAFDVCLLPYLINEETENLSALKLYDYMAAGKPIVSTDFPAAREFLRVVYIADSKEAFTRSIEEALLETDNGFFNERRHIAFLNRWDRRVKQLSQLIEHHLDNQKN